MKKTGLSRWSPRLIAALALLLSASRGPVSVAAPARPDRDSAVAERTRNLLPEEFREYESEHYLVFSDAGRKWSKAQLKRLEQTFSQFDRYCDRLALRPRPLRHKLVCVLFGERRRYAEFGRNHDRIFADWNHGYYSPAHDRVVLFNGEADPDADEFAAQRTTATTIHEAIHQLHYHTAIQNKHVQYPLWSCEGLATSFETVDPSRPFGPDSDFAPRRIRFDRLLERDGLMPLDRLVGLDRMPDNDRDTVFTVYNQSYALVTWLMANRPEQFRRYLRLMRDHPPGRPDPAQHRRIFSASFGDPAQLELAWLTDEIRRVGPGSVDPELLNRMNVAADSPDWTITWNENDESATEPHDDEMARWLDDLDVARAADGMQHVSGVSRTAPPAP